LSCGDRDGAVVATAPAENVNARRAHVASIRGAKMDGNLIVDLTQKEWF
jgi:hypothetical protein